MMSFLTEHGTVAKKQILNVSTTFVFLYDLKWLSYEALNFKNPVTYVLYLLKLNEDLFMFPWD